MQYADAKRIQGLEPTRPAIVYRVFGVLTEYEVSSKHSQKFTNDWEQGYSDFEKPDFYRANGVLYYWAVGTTLSCAVLVVGLSYIVVEYCTQSHLATEDFESARQGIKLTRQFKKYTLWFRSLLKLSDKVLFIAWKVVRHPWQKVTGWQPTTFNKTLVWDWKVKERRMNRAPEQANDRGSRRQSST